MIYIVAAAGQLRTETCLKQIAGSCWLWSYEYPKGLSFVDSVPDLMVESCNEDFQLDVCCFGRAMRHNGVTREGPHGCPNSPGSVSRNVSHPSRNFPFWAQDEIKNVSGRYSRAHMLSQPWTYKVIGMNSSNRTFSHCRCEMAALTWMSGLVNPNKRKGKAGSRCVLVSITFGYKAAYSSHRSHRARRRSQESNCVFVSWKGNAMPYWRIFGFL